jgi:hypothetical protein
MEPETKKMVAPQEVRDLQSQLLESLQIMQVVEEEAAGSPIQVVELEAQVVEAQVAVQAARLEPQEVQTQVAAVVRVLPAVQQVVQVDLAL